MMRIMFWLLALCMLIMTACTANSPVEVDTPQEIATAVPPPTAISEPAPTDTAVSLPTATTAPTTEPMATAVATTKAAIVATIPRFPIKDRFTIFGEEPAVPHGPQGAFDQQYTDPGAAVFHDGKYHMFHNGFTGWPAPVGIAYSTSEDGIHWTRVQDGPVFDGSDLDYAGVTVLASSALVQEDGTWVLYFYTWDQRSWPTSTGAIGMATAPDPLGPWTAAEAPILVAGGEGEWDSVAVRAPSVVQTEEGYIMYYSGHDRNEAAIGRATSPDGITWTKYNDPTTTEAPFAESDPVFSGSGEETWDKTNVYQPRIQFTPAGWVMLYSSAENVARSPVKNQHGLALSEDGMVWMRSDQTIFAPKDVRQNGVNFWYTELLYADDTYFVYLELGTGNNTEVYVATLEGDLP